MHLTRARFLTNAAGMLTVPMFLEHCARASRLSGENPEDPFANAKSLGLTDPIFSAINCGIAAPNPHNTQAWKFKILGPLEMLLYVDEQRILPVTDPPTRQIHIGQGTFLETLNLGANRLGYTTRIDLFP